MKTVFLTWKKKKRSKGALFLALLLTPPAAYAVYMLTLVLLDSFRGDGLILHQYALESRHQLAVQLLSDSRQAMPVFYVVAWLLWLEMYLLFRYTEWGGMLPAAMAGALTGVAIAAVFVEMTFNAVIPAISAGFLAALVLAWVIRPSRSSG